MPEAWPVPHRFGPAVASVASEDLDCLQTTFALFCDEVRGPASHEALGAHLLFPSLDPVSRPWLRAGLDQRREEARRYLGARTGQPFAPSSAEELVDFASRTSHCYAVADAYDSTWLPIAGHQHTPHSFAVTIDRPDVVVVDVYSNITPMGEATPGAWRLDGEELRQLVAGGVLLHTVGFEGDHDVAHSPAVRHDVLATAEASVALFPVYAERLVDLAVRGDGDALVLDVWQLARDRRLHSRWLARHDADGGRTAIDQAWRDLATRAYIVQRRAQRAGGGRYDVLAAELVELLRRDVAELRRVHDAEEGQGADRASVERIVHVALIDVLGLEPHELEGADDLRDLPGFQSFRLLQVLDKVEGETAVSPALDSLEADLFTVTGLVDLFAHSPASPQEARK